MSRLQSTRTTYLDSLCHTVCMNHLGKISGSVHRYLQKHTGAQVIIVTGSSGVGKSSLIKLIAGRDVYIGSTLDSGTLDCKLIPARILGRKFLFLEMAGFDTSEFSDIQIYKHLINCMAAISPFVTFIGILYVDDLREPRLTPAAVKILDWLFRFCGPQYGPNITLVTTKWDGRDTNGLEARQKILNKWQQQDRLNRLVRMGALWYHHGITVDDRGTWRTLDQLRMARERATSARDMIMTRYFHASNMPLRINKELDFGTRMEDTAASRLLLAPYLAATTGFGCDDADESTSQGDDEASKPSSMQDEETRTNAESEPRANDPRINWWSPPTWQDLKPWIALLFKFSKLYWNPRSSCCHCRGNDRFTRYEGLPSWTYFTPEEAELWNDPSTSWIDVLFDAFEHTETHETQRTWCEWIVEFF